MYRNYENPHELEEELQVAQKFYDKLVADCINWEAASPRWDYMASVHEDIEDLKARINFAWQDAYED